MAGPEMLETKKLEAVSGAAGERGKALIPLREDGVGEQVEVGVS
jgi:hypothetical protein